MDTARINLAEGQVAIERILRDARAGNLPLDGDDIAYLAFAYEIISRPEISDAVSRG